MYGVSACGSAGIGGDRAVALGCTYQQDGRQYNENTYPFTGGSPAYFSAQLLTIAIPNDEPGSVRFTVIADGSRVLFDQELGSLEGVRSVRLDLPNIRLLSLRVTCDATSDWGVFEEAVVGD